MRTKQEILDIVVPHAMMIVAKPSRLCRTFRVDSFVREHGGDDALPCFIGALIPDSLGLNANCTSIDALIFLNPRAKEFFCDDIDFLFELQRIHDQTSVDLLIPKLKDFAKKHDLHFPAI
jgi:hypothetical protein